MDQQTGAVAAFQRQKQALRLIHTSVKKVHDRFLWGCRTCRVYYLGFGRNAWHSTWINRYYPGTISFFLGDVQKTAEDNRVQGSQFRIQTRPALVLQLEHQSFVLTTINSLPAADCKELISEIRQYGLHGFLAHPSLETPNTFLFFCTGGYLDSEISLPKIEAAKWTSCPQGQGRTLSWIREQTEPDDSGWLQLVNALDDSVVSGPRRTSL